ncbi:MAG: phosphate ABC transporter ATP-binding protein [Caldilineales bacterium]
MTDLLYHLHGVTQRYGARTVLHVHDLGIRQGEVMALIGPSGAGKSTLLRLLNFLEAPAAGAISFRGQRFDALNPAPLEVRRRVTTVFQRPVLLSRSVYDNVRYGLQLRGERNGRAEVVEALEAVGLTEFARQQARTLSGGEAQRVALARALVLRPDVLLLDEPTANLDPYNVSLIEQIIGRSNREQGTTVVVVTHNLHQARRLGTRVGLLLDGAVVEVADTEQFFRSPSDPRTARFIHGEMVY